MKWVPERVREGSRAQTTQGLEGLVRGGGGQGVVTEGGRYKSSILLI